MHWHGVLSGVLLLWAAPCWAGDNLVRVACNSLSTEQASEVEARVRASLLTSEQLARQVRIACQPGTASVEVDSSSGSLARQVPTSALRLQDELVEAVDELLRELAERRAEAAHATAQEPAVRQAEPLPARPDPSSGLAPPLPAAISTERLAWLTGSPAPVTTTSAVKPELLAEATAESWSGVLALGGNLSVSHGTGALRYGLSVGGANASGVSASFAVNEWRARAELGWQPPWAAGFRGALGFGPSLLIVTPEGDTVARAGTVSRAWFAELALVRPFWFGSLGLAPSVTLRLFAAGRDVNVDASRRFALAGVAPAFGLGAIYALN